MTLVWFRLDLRVRDNPALTFASARGRVQPAFVWAPEEEAPWAPGAASRWWLHHSLEALRGELERLGLSLVLRRGPTLESLEDLAVECGADAVAWNRRYEPQVLKRDAHVEASLRARGLVARSFNAALLHEPLDLAKSDGTPYRVFTRFWTAALSRPVAAPLALPRAPKAPPRIPRSEELAALELQPRPDWAHEFPAFATPGEAGARASLKRFLGGRLGRYAAERDFPARPSTSRLSAHLHFGEIGPRQVWKSVIRRCASESPTAREAVDPATSNQAAKFLAELGWREFAHHLLVHFPHTPERPLRAEFDRMAWQHRPDWVRAWQRGQTGFPLVDAGMRELWRTGVMHNRVRMVAASFLVKHLLQPWQEGARWFWDTLVDADLASNTLGWQWVAGCGADAAPFFRVFNPSVQQANFDPQGEYVRRWAPGALAADGSHPLPMVDHALARARALEAFAALRRGGTSKT